LDLIARDYRTFDASEIFEVITEGMSLALGRLRRLVTASRDKQASKKTVSPSDSVPSAQGCEPQRENPLPKSASTVSWPNEKRRKGGIQANDKRGLDSQPDPANLPLYISEQRRGQPSVPREARSNHGSIL